VLKLTRNDVLDSLQMGIECGADDYIPKNTFMDAVLLETLQQIGIPPK
jgi:DNA-binding response OmpR family regulator